MPISFRNLSIRKRWHAKTLLLGPTSVFLFSLLAPALQAQNYLGQIGAPTFTTALPLELGFLNASNGNLHLTVPLGSFPQRGSLGFAAGVVYDSSIWVNAGTSWQPINVPNSWGGWRMTSSATTGTVNNDGTSHLCDTPPPYHSYTTHTGFRWTAPDGTTHFFYGIFTEYDPTGCDQGNITSGDSFASDSSGYHMYVTNYGSAVVYAPDGTQVYPAVEDTNGNYFSADSNGNAIDTLGRKPVTVTTNGSTITYAVLNSQGTTSNYVVTTTSISVSTAFNQSGVTEYSGPLTVIQKITLPDNTFYQFGYDSYGELNSITLPTGGQIAYSYTNFTDAYGNIGRWATSRVSGGGTWTYIPAVITTCGSGQQGCQQNLTVTKPSTDTTVYTFTLNNGAWESAVSSYTGASTLLWTVSNTWDFSQPCSPSPCTGASNIRILTAATTLPTPGGNYVTSQTKTTYNDTNTMNVSSIKDWKFYAGSSPTFPTTPDRETDIIYHATFGNNITNRVSQTTVKDSGGSVVAQTNYFYDDAATLFNSSPATGIANHDDTNYSLSNTVRGNLTTIQRCTLLTSCSSNNVQTLMTYDTTGQVLSVKDPNTNTTSFGYTDSFFKDVGDGPSNLPQAYSPPAPTNAYVTRVAPPLIPASTFGYYYHTGQHASSTDANGNTSYSHFFDSNFSRPTSTVLPDGGWSYSSYASSETQADVYKGITAAFSTSAGTGIRQDEAVLDNLGRLVTQKLMSDPEGTSIVTTNYDTAGRGQSTSHPYRGTGDSTYGFETSTYDGLNRTIKTTHQDGTYSQTFFGAAVSGSGVNLTQLCPGTYGLGYPVLLIDEAGKKREIWTDGFGRTIEGDEPDSSGNLNTGTAACYQYDSLGNLLQVVSGSQSRTFTYNSLSLVTSVTSPESGAVCFGTYSGGVCQGNGYDANGNLVTKTTPAPNLQGTTTVTTTYLYDALNRPTNISYGTTTPIATPTVQYGYDGTPLTGCSTTPPALTDSNAKGRMISMCDGSGATSWSHDTTGKILTEKRTTLGVTETISYSYNLDGSIAAITYPSGNQVNYTVNNAQRLTAAKDVANNIQFATAASYVPPGGLSGVITGQISGGFGGITESHSYNSSLEYTSTKATSAAGTAMDLTLSYALSGGDNGTVTGVTNNADSGRTQSFTYDPLNRILSAMSSATSGVDCWGQNFGPDGNAADDALANLTKINSGTQTSPPCPYGLLNVTVDANNHINSDSTFWYDSGGNMTMDGKGSTYWYTFDAENHLIRAVGMSGGPYCYVYDGNGLRVGKKSGANMDCTGGTVTILYWRSISGDALAETDSTGSTTNAAYNEYVFFDGRRIASRNGAGAIFYYFADQLGSTRTITTGSGPGQTPGQLCYDADFTPYGQELSHTERLQTTACPPNYKFTGYERDPETAYGQTDTGLDYAFARHYSSRLGRFLSTDPLGGSIGNLQSHNAYSYSWNDPCNLVDPLGLNPTPCTLNVISDAPLPEGIQKVVQGIFNKAGINITFDNTSVGNIAVKTNVSIPNALGRDPDLGPVVQLNNSRIGNAATQLAGPGNAQGALQMGTQATGVVLSHEMGHFLLQQGHPQVGVVGIMRKGNDQGKLPFYLDMAGLQRFTLKQAAMIRKRCKDLTGQGGGGGGGGVDPYFMGYIPIGAAIPDWIFGGAPLEVVTSKLIPYVE
jgi:RHS repeat-associated protein